MRKSNILVIYVIVNSQYKEVSRGILNLSMRKSNILVICVIIKLQRKEV